MDDIRRQLDALMGADRNGDLGTQKAFYDHDVCKNYLVGAFQIPFANEKRYTNIAKMNNKLKWSSKARRDLSDYFHIGRCPFQVFIPRSYQAIILQCRTMCS